jgi:chemotaxis protein CheD
MSAAAAPPAADARAEIRVGMSALAVAAGDRTLVTIALGSCVAIALWDADARVAGLAHVLLPDAALSRVTDLPARFPATAVPALVAAMAAAGAPGPYTARLVGGASMFRALLEQDGVNVGARNVEAARAALAAAGIPCVGEDVGGEHGRSVYLHAGSGRLRVRSLAAGDREL